MQIKFQYSKQEYARAFWMNCKRSLRPRLDAIVGILVAIYGSWLLYEGEIFWGSLLLGIIGLFIALLLAARFIMPYYIYKHAIINRGEYFLEFSEEGIHFKASGIDSKLNWTMYKHVVADSEHYLLYFGKNQYSIIPKRVFKPADQLKAFEILLQKHIKDVNV